MTTGTSVAAVLLHLVAVSAVLVTPLMWARGGHRRPAAWLGYALALALLAAWGVTSDRAGAATDEIRTIGSVLETAWWLVLALGATAVSVVVGRRRPTRSA